MKVRLTKDQDLELSRNRTIYLESGTIGEIVEGFPDDEDMFIIRVSGEEVVLLVEDFETIDEDETGFTCVTCDSPTLGQQYCSESCREQDHRECPESPTGKHEMVPDDLCIHQDFESLVLTVTCAHCQETGMLSFDPNDIEW